MRKTSDDIRAELAVLVDEADAITAIEELDETQRARFDELTAKDEGLVALKQLELTKAVEVEDRMKALAVARAESDPRSPLQAALGDDKPAPQPRLYSPTNRLKAFKGENALKDAHDCGMFMRALASRAVGKQDAEAEKAIEARGWGGILNTATEGTDTAGGHTVPDPLSAAFIEYRESVGISRQLADIRQMTSDTLKIPKLTAGPTVQYPGEATATTPTDQTWGSVSLTAVERSVLSKVSNPLQQDSLINFTDNVISRFGFEFAKQEDNELFNGDGTSTYGGETGILSALGAAGKNVTTGNTYAELALSDFTDTMGLLPSEHWGMPAWVASSSFYHTVMLKLLAAAGGNTIAALESGGAMRPSFLGYPVFLTDRMPTAEANSQTCALFGTFRDAVIIGDRTPIEVMTSEHRYFEERVVGIIGCTRYDINVHNAGDGSNAGAVVGLTLAAS